MRMHTMEDTPRNAELVDSHVYWGRRQNVVSSGTTPLSLST